MSVNTVRTGYMLERLPPTAKPAPAPQRRGTSTGGRERRYDCMQTSHAAGLDPHTCPPPPQYADMVSNVRETKHMAADAHERRTFYAARPVSPYRVDGYRDAPWMARPAETEGPPGSFVPKAALVARQDYMSNGGGMESRPYELQDRHARVAVMQRGTGVAGIFGM